MDKDEWTIHWEQLKTPGDLLFLMFTQVSANTNAAIRAGRTILEGRFDLATAASFFFSAAVVGDFFWPSPRRSQRLANAFPARAEDMRHLLGLDDAEPENLDRIRNDLTHVDERLEELYLEGPQEPLLAWGNGSASAEGTRRYMNYDPETKTIHSLGHDVNVEELVAWLENLQARLSEVTLHLMRRADGIGGIQGQ